MTVNSKSKGNGGEREFAKLLQEITTWPVERNLAQTRDGGCDIYLGPFYIEVKRSKNVTQALIRRWWEQAREQAKAGIPVLAFRQDRQDWRVCLPVCCLSKELPLPFSATVEMTVEVFVHVLEREIRVYEPAG